MNGLQMVETNWAQENASVKEGRAQARETNVRCGQQKMPKGCTKMQLHHRHGFSIILCGEELFYLQYD